MKLESTTALVTGAGSGIGREISLAFAREGATVGVNDLSGARASEVAAEIEALGSGALALPADVSEEEPVKNMVEKMLATHGRIDILVNNAGIFNQGQLTEMSATQWDEMIRMDLTSVFLCTRSALPSMIEAGYGRIINVASQLGIKGKASLTHYCAAKAGVIGFTRALALEVGEHGITVNCIAPGPTATGLIPSTAEERAAVADELPLKRYGKVSEIAPTAILLASDPDGNLYTGQTLGPNSGDVMP